MVAPETAPILSACKNAPAASSTNHPIKQGSFSIKLRGSVENMDSALDVIYNEKSVQ